MDASGGVAAAEEQPVAAAVGQPALLSVAEFAAILPIVIFRKRAVELGLVVHVGSGVALRCRKKADIVADYKKKLDDLQRPIVSVGPSPSAANAQKESKP